MESEDARDIVCGLVNTGNTCFFNSTIQALAAVPEFHEYLRGLIIAHKSADDLRKLLERPLSSDTSGTATTSTEPPGSAFPEYDPPEKPYAMAEHPDSNVGGVAACILALLRALSWPRKSYFTRSETISPKVALGVFSSTFEDNGQHDAQVRVLSRTTLRPFLFLKVALLYLHRCRSFCFFYYTPCTTVACCHT